MLRVHARHTPARRASLSLCSLLALTASASFAATPPVPNYGISDAVRDANTPLRPDLPVVPQPPAPVIIQQDEIPMSLADGEKIAVRDIRVEGAEFLDPAELAPLLEPYRQRDLTMAQINEVANRVTVLCRSKGYLVARAYVPKQDVRGGELVIRVLIGKYGSFQMKNQSLVRDSLLQAVFDKTKESSVNVTRDGLERPMLLVNDMPGAGLPLVSIAPGREPGTSDFLIDTPAGKRLAGYALLDNYGSRFTGKNRLSAGLDVNSPFGIADRLSLSALTSKAAGLQNGRGAYAFPLSANGLRGEVAVSRTTYKLGAEYADLDATGTANVVEATLSYPIKRTRDDSVYLALNVASKHLRDNLEIESSSVGKRTNVATLSLQRETYGHLLGYNTYVNVSGGLSYGRLEFNDAAQKAQNKAGANTVGDYGKVNLAFTGNLAFDARWSAGASLVVQQSLGKNLDGIEQLSISGPAGIKSYPDGVIGDNGYLLNAELKRALPPLASFNQVVGLFGNYGAVRPQDGSYTTVGRIAISDVGLAYYVSGKMFFGRVQLAHSLGSKPETRSYNHDTKLLAQLGMRF